MNNVSKKNDKNHTKSVVDTYFVSFVQVSGPLMVYAFCEVSVAHSLDYLIDFFASTVSSLYILESPTNSFSAGEQQSIYFLL